MMAKQTIEEVINRVLKHFNDATKDLWYTGNMFALIDKAREENNIEEVNKLIERQFKGLYQLSRAIVEVCPKRYKTYDGVNDIVSRSPFVINNYDVLKSNGHQIRNAVEEYDKAQADALLNNPSKIGMIEQFIDSEGFEIRFSILHNNIFYIDKETGMARALMNNDATEIWDKYNANTTREKKIARGDIQPILSAIAHREGNEYNPMIEVFDNLPKWDGEDRINALLSILKGDNIPITKLDRNKLYYFSMQCYDMATTDNPKGSDFMLILHSKAQGTGKSYFVYKFFLEDYCLNKYGFSSTKPSVRDFDPNNYDDVICATGAFGIEFAEFGTSISRKSLDALKDFITKPKDDYRVKYEVIDRSFPRRTNYIGTVNDEQFLNAEDGNRRFLIIETSTERFSDKLADFDFIQYWAQIKQYTEDRRKEVSEEGNREKVYSLPYDIQKEIQKENERYKKKLPGQEEIEDYIQSGFDNGWKEKYIYISDLRDDDIHYELRALRRYTNHQIARVLNRLNIKSGRPYLKEEKGKAHTTMYWLPYPPVLQGSSHLKDVPVLEEEKQ